MSDSGRPHRRQPTRLPRPWDSPGTNTGVSCHVFLQCMKVKSESEVTWLCLTLSDLMGCSPSGSSVHGIFQARVLEWGATAFSIYLCAPISNKASRSDGIPGELFNIQKIMLLNSCTQYVSKFGKLTSGHRTEKGRFSFQSQRRSMPKNVQTTTQLYSFHMLAGNAQNLSS